jgi:hypothetical protein
VRNTSTVKPKSGRNISAGRTKKEAVRNGRSTFVRETGKAWRTVALEDHVVGVVRAETRLPLAARAAVLLEHQRSKKECIKQ